MAGWSGSINVKPNGDIVISTASGTTVGTIKKGQTVSHLSGSDPGDWDGNFTLVNRNGNYWVHSARTKSDIYDITLPSGFFDKPATTSNTTQVWTSGAGGGSGGYHPDSPAPTSTPNGGNWGIGDADHDGILNGVDKTPNAATADLAKYGLDKNGNPLPKEANGFESMTPEVLAAAGLNPQGIPLIKDGPFAGHTQAEVDAFIANNPAPAGGGSGGGSGGGVAPTPNVGGTAPVPATPSYTLVRGDGPNTGNTTDLKGNGAAVYAINTAGERFHVTENLYNELVAAGKWTEPTVKPQAEIDGMKMRYTVGTMGDLGTIDSPTAFNGITLIKGDGGPLDANTLKGNGNAVYGVNDQGQKLHLTEAAYNQLVTNAGGTPPAIITLSQAAVDEPAVAGAYVEVGGHVTQSVDPIMDPALTAAMSIIGAPAPTAPEAGTIVATDTPPVPTAPAPAADAPSIQPVEESLQVGMSAENTGQFRLIRGNGPNTGNTVDLRGNGAAVYAINAAGQKFHITEELYNKMNANGTWKEPEVIGQADVDGMPNGTTVSMTNMEQLRSINIGAGSEFRFIKGGLNGTGVWDGDNKGPLEGNSAAVYALTSNGDRYHVTAELANKLAASGQYDYNNVEVLNQSEVDSMGTMRGSMKTVKQLNAAVKNPTGGLVVDSSSPSSYPPVVAFTPPN